MRSFKEMCSPREGHLGWMGGDVRLVGLNEDTLSHLSNIQDIPHESTPDHKISEPEMQRLHQHLKSLSQEKLTHRIYAYKEISSDINSSLRHGFIHHEEGTMQPNPYHYWRYGDGDPYEDPRANHNVIHQRVNDMDKVTSFRTSEPMTLYRGIYRKSGIHRFPNGSHFVDHGYTGTSLKKSEAYGFAEPHDTFTEKDVPEHLGGHHLIARIHAPAGTKGHYLDMSENYHDTEHEFLLHRGTHFQVTGHSRQSPKFGSNIGKLHIVHLRVLGHQPLPIQYRHAPELYGAQG